MTLAAAFVKEECSRKLLEATAAVVVIVLVAVGWAVGASVVGQWLAAVAVLKRTIATRASTEAGLESLVRVFDEE